MKAERPRKSHYLPRFYLAGFTASGKVGSKLYVFDRTTGQGWQSSPKNAAIERDFYLVDLGSNEDPDIMEKIFSRLEGEFSRVLRKINTQLQLPTDGDDFNWFLNFVASMVTRIPHTRKVLSNVIDRATRTRLRQKLATREGWAQFRRVCKAAGHQIRNDEYEEYKHFAESENYSANLDQTSHVQMMVKQMMDALLPALAERSWALGIASDDAPDFICSDVPVGVWPTNGADVGKPISVRSRNTVLSFPISRCLVAIARYERQEPVRVVIPRGVCLFNTWTLSEARQIFAPAPDFSYLAPDGTIGGKADLREYHRRRQACADRTGNGANP
jgi:hypothetical protein